MKTRLNYVDVAKGISMICIIIGHLSCDTINRVVFTFHVPIFFLITGYFINNRDTIISFIKKKIRTLIVPYYVTCFVIIVLAAVIELVKTQDTNALYNCVCHWLYAAAYGSGNNYNSPFPIYSIGAIWFLLATFWASVFLRVSFCCNKIIRPCFIILLFFLGYYSKNLFWFPFSIQAGACATLFMYIGYLVQVYTRLSYRFPQEVKVFFIISSLIIWCCFIKNFQSFWLVGCDFGRGAVDIISSLCACSIVILCSRYIDRFFYRISSFLSFIGKNSIIVLCVHIVELKLLPWWKLIDHIESIGWHSFTGTMIIAIGKLILILIITLFCSKCRYIKHIFIP